MKIHIYLFRHGQSTFNRDGRFTGWMNASLTKKGIADAKKVAQKLKDKEIDLAYSSDLIRCRRTLNEVLKFHKECKKVVVDKRLRERNYGAFNGLYHEDIIKKYGQAKYDKWHRAYDFPPPKGESMKMVVKRVNPFIKELVQKAKKEKINIAVSASGNSMRPIRKYFEKLTIKEMMNLENPWDDYFEYTIEV
jgi:2,3-bisphosphoglycerate-dependent phosphoglycerate mutase